MSGGTDLDILVSLGYSKQAARNALSCTNGDRIAALEYLRSGAKIHKGEWLKPNESDWMYNIAQTNLPKDEKMRALWKSPLTISVSSFFVGPNNAVFYRCRVITHVRSWICEKRFADFVELKNSLPLGTTWNFKVPFPPSFSLFGKVDGVEMAEQRRQQLDDFIRELTLSESCMRNPIILEKIHTIFRDEKSQYPGSPVPSTMKSTDNSSGLYVSASESASAPALSPHTSLIPVMGKIPKISNDKFPLSVTEFDRLLSQRPFRVDISELTALSAMVKSSTSQNTRKNSRINDKNSSGSGSSGRDKGADHQLEKDLSRDRVIINGRRFQGGESGAAAAGSTNGPDVNGSDNGESEYKNSRRVVDFTTSIIMDAIRSHSKARAKMKSNNSNNNYKPQPAQVNSVRASDSSKRSVNADLMFADLPIGNGTTTSVRDDSTVSIESVKMFARSLLQQLSRTESAFLSLAALTSIVDTANINASMNNSNSNKNPDEPPPMPLMVVPEAFLAEPMQIEIQIKDNPIASATANTTPAAATTTTATTNPKRPVGHNHSHSHNRQGSKDTSDLSNLVNNKSSDSHSNNRTLNCYLDCELQTSTVYRFCDDDMNTHMQVRVVFFAHVHGVFLQGEDLDTEMDMNADKDTDKYNADGDAEKFYVIENSNTIKSNNDNTRNNATSDGTTSSNEQYDSSTADNHGPPSSTASASASTSAGAGTGISESAVPSAAQDDGPQITRTESTPAGPPLTPVKISRNTSSTNPFGDSDDDDNDVSVLADDRQGERQRENQREGNCNLKIPSSVFHLSESADYHRLQLIFMKETKTTSRDWKANR